MSEREKISLKAARINANLTQKEVADRLHISEATYIRWEKEPSKMSVQKTREVASIVNYPYDNIIFLP